MINLLAHQSVENFSIVCDLPSLALQEKYVLALRERWDFALDKEGVPRENGKLIFSKILSAYGEVWRHYHNLEHLYEMFKYLSKLDQSIYDSSEVIFAVLFHDFIYKPKASDNEVISASSCVQELKSIGVSEQIIEKTKQLILLTKNHLISFGDNTTNAFIDADLMILSTPWDDYLAYAKKIRREYSRVPVDLYIQGRTQFLENMLNAQPIYRNLETSNRLDPQAYNNLAKELLLLRSEPETILGTADERMLLEWPAKTIAITGTIGSGKSSVLKELKGLGAFVVSADEVVKSLYAPNSQLADPIKNIFGQEAVNQDCSINREYIAKIIFSNAEKKSQIELLVHPLVHSYVSKLFSEAIKRDNSLLVYEMPLLFENGLDALGFKKLVVVKAKEEDCVRRIIARSDGRITDELARKRISSQLPAEYKAARADIIIENNGTIEELRQRCKALLS